MVSLLDILLDSLMRSVKHLQAIDEIFSKESYPDKQLYLKSKKEIRRLNKKSEALFSDELYVGGKKGGKNGYGRQMILSDLITYVVAGRGYFYATRSKESMQTFIEITLNMVNQLMLFDGLTTEAKLRKRVLKKLEKRIGREFFKDVERRNENKALRLYKGAIGLPLETFRPGRKVLKLFSGDLDAALKGLENWFDSLLPKELGLWGELLVYVYLLRQKLGYVFPLLLTQYLISGNYDDILKVPDFLIIPFGIKQKTIGIEVGGGKETQSTKFSNLTGITIATKANADNPKRCPICGKWILFCPMIIKRFGNLDFEIANISRPVRCNEECDILKKRQIVNGGCPYSSVKGVEPKKHVMRFEYKPTSYHFHLRCALNDPKAAAYVKQHNIVTYYPYIRGIEDLESLLKEDKDRELERLRVQIEGLKKELAESN